MATTGFSRELRVQDRILYAACSLFMTQGFYKTTMRQIAEEAHVGLGLINYHFGTKENIAVSFYSQMRNRCKEVVDGQVTMEEDPYAHLALLLYLEFAVNTLPAFYKIYYDCLDSGIYEKYILTTDTDILDRILALENKSVPKDLLQLYCVFSCANIEKTLVTNKPKGLFPTIEYEEIPQHVFRISAGTFSNNTDAMDRAIRIARAFVSNTEWIKNTFTLEYILGIV